MYAYRVRYLVVGGEVEGGGDPTFLLVKREKIR